MIGAVVFDMDGLLIDSEPFWKQAEIEVFGTVGVTLTEAMCGQTTGLRMDAAVQHWFDRFPWTTKPKDQVEREVKVRVAELVAEQALPLPGVDRAVELCLRRGLPLGVCSSSPYIVIEAVMKKLGIARHMQVLYSAEDELHGKPHPGAYMTTAARLGQPPQACLAFEDSMNGMISAKAARMKVVAVPERGRFGRSIYDFCDAQIESLEQFDEAMLERLGR